MFRNLALSPETSEENTAIEKRLEELETEVASLRQLLTEAELFFDSLKYAKVDITKMINGENIDLLEMQELVSGKVGAFTGQVQPNGSTGQAERLLLSAGTERFIPGANSSNVFLENQGFTTGSTNWSFMYGYRSPQYGGSQAKLSTTTKLYIRDTSLKDDELVGAYLLLGPSISGYTETHIITANTSNTITFATASTITEKEIVWFVSMPIYLGSANFPWRRVYLTDDIRFGIGPSGGSDVIFIKYGAGSPEGVITANRGSLYLRTDGGPSSCLYVKEADDGEATGWSQTS